MHRCETKYMVNTVTKEKIIITDQEIWKSWGDSYSANLNEISRLLHHRVCKYEFLEHTSVFRSFNRDIIKAIFNMFNKYPVVASVQYIF